MTRTPSQSWPPGPKGYFAIGAERMSKSLNLGNLMRSAHGFGASFTFTVGANYQALEAHADTSKGQLHLPHYNWTSLDEIVAATKTKPGAHFKAELRKLFAGLFIFATK